MDVRTRSIRFALLLVCSPGAACATGGLPEGLAPAPDGTGPAIVWDLEAVPLPVIPLPNDAASWPDPTSPTGLRINASTVATTRLESRLRALYDRLDGWGASMPVTIPFDGPIDVAGLMGRQGPGRLGARAVREHAIYLVDLETGLPVPLDVQTGLNPIVAARTDGYFTGDPRASGSNLLFETVDEDLDDDGRLDPGEDGDLDGVLDEPNTPDGRLDGRPHETVDRLLTFYERQTNTLVLRPLLPLAERRRYAVVVTTRLRGAGGGTVRSPFAWVNPLPQNEVLAALPRIFAAHPDLYGDLAERGFERVAFAWAFTTQSVRADLEAIREGLYGRGPLARLAREFPPVLVPAPLHGGRRPGDCPEPGRMYTITPAELELALGTLASEAFGVSSEQVEALLRTFDAVDYFAIGFFESPYFLGDPDAEHVDETFDVHLPTGRARVRRDLVPMVITVPKPTERARQPFPVTFYAHGYGNLAVESLGFAGLVARQGIATVSIDAQGHGLPLTAAQVTLLEALFDSQCLYPMGRALRNGRARDLNADRSADSAGLFFSAYQFHTRDALRQTVVDWLQAIRVVRHFSGAPGYPDPTPWVPGRIPLRYARGETLAFDGDVDGDGDVDRAGDFDGNGIADFGGWDARYAMWGVSLGGIVTSLVTGFEPAIRTAVPVAGGGGLFDIGLRTDLRTGRDPIWLRVMGPLLIGGPSSGPSSETSCEAGARSLRFEVPDLNQRARVEFACLAPDALQPGDLVVVRNFANRETRCAWAGADGRFGLGIPADEGDPLELSIWRSVTDVDGSHCEVRAGPTEPHVRISTWQVDPPSGSGGCRSCARYQDRTFERGEPLVAPTEGLGLRRQSPELRRLASLAQMALDPADPIHAARHWILDPPTAPDVPDAGPRSVLVMATAGDTVVPVASTVALARAAGILPFLPPDAPDAWAEYRASADFRARRGFDSPADLLVTYHVVEGLSRLERHPVAGAPTFLFDVDDLSEGRQRFDAEGRRQVREDEEGFRPERLSPPLRWVRASRPMASPTDVAVWDPMPGERISGLLVAMIYPRGQHVFEPVDPRKPFDEGRYLASLIGWYLRSGGTDLPYRSNPTGHHCLAAVDGCVHP